MADKEYRLGIPGERINDALIKAEKIVSYKPDLVYAAGDVCVHKGEVWTNTSGNSTQGVEPGTNYNIWNVGYSNPNLLDNPWFTVNQRGVSSWSDWSYGVDRWKVNGSTATLNSDGTVTLIQGCEMYNTFDGNPFVGNNITASILFSDGRVLSGSGYIEKSLSWKSFFEVDDGNGHIVRVNSEEGGNLNFAIICTTEASSPLIVRAAKLELGSVSTLANDTQPDYATELLKCQRYYQKDSLHTTGSTISGTYAVNTFLKANMRIVPTVTITECAYWNGTNWIPISYNIIDQLESTGYFSCWVNGLPTNTQVNIIIRYSVSADL